MKILPCALVHHTGTMIRFRPRQLEDLPGADADLQIMLPTGRIVDGHFRRNVANPNISGVGLVGYIKRLMDFGEVERALIEQVSPSTWRLYRLGTAVEIAGNAHVSSQRVRRARLLESDVARLAALADAFADRRRRLQEYKRVLRPTALRRLMINLVGPTCQIDGCSAAELFSQGFEDEDAGRAVVEVHHIEAIARCIDHHPRNLCVLCANHHRLIHGWGSWEPEHVGPNVVLRHDDCELRIVREGTAFGGTA